MAAADPSEFSSSPPLPQECGWVRMTDISSGHPGRLAVFPRSGRCSVPPCQAATTAAVQRGPSRTRDAYWQLYCAEHAYERGVDTGGERLHWVDGFLLTEHGQHWMP
jgi:hypothetical protein